MAYRLVDTEYSDRKLREILENWETFSMTLLLIDDKEVYFFIANPTCFLTRKEIENNGYIIKNEGGICYYERRGEVKC